MGVIPFYPKKEQVVVDKNDAIDVAMFFLESALQSDPDFPPEDCIRAAQSFLHLASMGTHSWPWAETFLARLKTLQERPEQAEPVAKVYSIGGREQESNLPEPV